MADNKNEKPAVPEKTAIPEKTDGDKMREAISAAVSAALSEALPVAVAMATKIAGDQAEANKPKFAVAKSTEKCGLCRQLRVACGDKHSKMVVFPSMYGQFFQGIFINGVQYLSNNSQHQIIVPESNNIAYSLENWERNEREQAVGKQVQHNSGTLSANGSSDVRPAGGTGSSFR